MSLTLSTDDLARLEAANRALLSPLAVPDTDAWRTHVVGTIRDLLDADCAAVGLPNLAGYAESPAFPASAMAGWQHYIEEPLLTGTAAPDPLPLEFFERRARLGLDVLDFGGVNQVLGGHLAASPFYNDVFVANRLLDMQSVYVPAPRSAGSSLDAAIGVYFERVLPEARRQRGLALLRMLKPAFAAGLDALARLSAHRAALDALSEPLAVFDADGRESHRNSSLVALFEQEPERARVEVELIRQARSMRALAFPRLKGSAAAPSAMPPERVVTTARAHYTLRGVLFPAGGFGPDEAYLISVAATVEPSLPTAEAVRARHGLTPREAEVALLFVEGLGDKEVAARLGISWHTARRHAEAVLAKLEVPGRAAVAARLLLPS